MNKGEGMLTLQHNLENSNKYLKSPSTLSHSPDQKTTVQQKKKIKIRLA